MSIFERNAGTPTDPFKIYTEDDLIELTNYGDLNNSDLHYQLQNDIHLEKEWVKGIGNTSGEAFSGTFDGNGYKISNLFNSNITTSIFGLFIYTQGATIKNLEVDGINYSTSRNYTGGLVGTSNRGTLNIINTAVKNVEINITDSSRGWASAFVAVSSGGDVSIKDSYAYNVKITRSSSFSAGSSVIVGIIQGQDVRVENVFIFGDISLYTPQTTYNKRSRLDYGENIRGSFSGNLIQATTSSTHNGGASQRIQTPLVKDSYSNIVTFGPEEAWDMVDGELPFLTVFIKITEKIEERLIFLYSKGMYLESKWTKGFKNILNFFTNKNVSSTRTKRSPFRRLLSFTKDISLKMLFKRIGQKRVKSNSGLVVSNITKLKKLTETILSYSNKITSNYSKMKSGAKILEIYSDKISFRTTEIKKSLKKAVNYSKGIYDNLLKKITRRHNRKTQSFSGNISSDVLHSYLTRVTERVMSYSGHMRSIIRRASNRYDFEFRMVSNQANRISIRFKRFIRTMRATRSHSGMMTTFVRRLSRISAPTEIFARAIARTNSIKMRVKESFTKIRASNGGGD